MRKLILGTIAVLAFAASAHAVDVKAQADPQHDFSSLRTFSAKIETGWNNPISEKQVLQSVVQALEARGLQEAPEDQADARVAIHGATQNKQELSTFYSGGMGGWGYYGWGGGMGTATTTVNEYRQGTLLVDIFDAHNKQLVFRGSAEDELSDKPEKNLKKVDNATKKMFKDFPPGREVNKENAKKEEKKD
jgi:hypothetical protein